MVRQLYRFICAKCDDVAQSNAISELHIKKPIKTSLHVTKKARNSIMNTFCIETF